LVFVARSNQNLLSSDSCFLDAAALAVLPVAAGDSLNPHPRKSAAAPGCARSSKFKLGTRYVARPPISNELLEELSDGRIAYKLKRPWQDGTAAVVFEPAELLGTGLPIS
jgi:hypothetical protein